MSKRFKVGNRVRVIASDEIGSIMGREVIPTDEKRVRVEYIVKTGNGFDKWKAYTRKELEPLPKKEGGGHEYIKKYLIGKRRWLTMYAKVETYSASVIGIKSRTLSIGYSICNPEDEYYEKLGVRIAKRRSSSRPFCIMSSSFTGEFNADTVDAIMNVKAAYIKDNVGKFVTLPEKA